MNASARSGLAMIGVALGLFGLTFGIFNTVQTRQITYRKVEKSYVSKSIQEFSVNHSSTDLPIDYLELTDGSIFYLYHRDFPESPKLPDIHENDAISLVYDANTKKAIDESASLFGIDGTYVHIKGDGYQIVQFTFGYPNLTGQPSGQAVKSYASDDYVQHPTSYYRNNWVSLTGGGLLAVSIIITLACSFVLYRALCEEHFERRYKRSNSGYTIEAWRYKR